MDSSPSDLSKIAGPESMAAPQRNGNAPYGGGSGVGSSSQSRPQQSSTSQSQQQQQQQQQGSTSNGVDGGASTTVMSKKKRHRAGKKRRNRRQSFIAPSETGTEIDTDQRPSILDANRASAEQTSFYRLKSAARSNTSLESEALLDHRGHQSTRPRRQSNQPQSMYAARGGMPGSSSSHKPGPSRHTYSSMQPSSPLKSRSTHLQRVSDSEDDDRAAATANDRTPLLSSAHRERPGMNRPVSARNTAHANNRRPSSPSVASSRRAGFHRHPASDDDDYDVNNPPSVPNSPKLGSLDDVMIAEQFSSGRSPRDAVIDIDRDAASDHSLDSSPSPQTGLDRRRNTHNLAENDVCYPGDVPMSEIGEGDEGDARSPKGGSHTRTRRGRSRRWPDLSVLNEWSTEEKEERQQEMVRAKKISEPIMLGGRLRRTNTAWHREEDDAPYRYTYFNETFDGTIHSRTISELCQFGASFRELFVPDPPELTDDSGSEDDDDAAAVFADRVPRAPTESGRESVAGSHRDQSDTRETSASVTPAPSQPETLKADDAPKAKEKRYGSRPTFWLDVLSPTEVEMKVLAKAFGIHQLTTEDILMQEPREKVELFQHYYFVNYRSFEQDKDSEDYLEPVNMYVVVFNQGVISFHFSMTPHPANVRRRIRQLNDYMSPSADWISYAIIDDITDVYAPLVQEIEDEVDDIDSAILALHSPQENSDEKQKSSGKAKELEYEKLNKRADDSHSVKGEPTAGDNSGDMLRRVGGGRKKVMTLYRLLGNKADVIKGFAKRCNEQWDVAPRSEIGLYLGDIQDHIVTMTSNLSHYENLLSRAHSNYLAQINIRMNERAEQTNDILGKLTVVGTIVLPMNIVTGMWGMNVLVPGQNVDSLTWFWSLAGGLLAFGLVCYFIAKRVYGIV